MLPAELHSAWAAVYHYHMFSVVVCKELMRMNDKSGCYFGDVTAVVDLMACSDVWRRTDAILRQTNALSSP